MQQQRTQGAPPATPPASARADWTTGYLPLLMGGIGAMGSALLMPWVTVAAPFVGEVTRRGVDTNTGKLFGLGVVLLALVARSEARKTSTTTLSVLLAGGLAMTVGLFLEYRDLTQMVAEIDRDFARARIDFGLCAMGIGLTVFLAGVVKRRLSQP